MATNNLVFNPAQINTDQQKKQNELLHNQAAPPVYPYQTDPNGVVPFVRTPQQSLPMNQTPVNQPLPQFQQNQQPMVQGSPTSQGVTPPPVTPISSGQQVQGQGLQNQLLEAGTQKALQGFQTPTLDLTSQKTQELLRDPNQGFDPQKNIQSQLGQYDLATANATEAARQKLAPTMGAGGVQGEFMGLNLANAQNRSAFGNQLTNEAQEQSRQNLINSLAEGRATTETEQNRFSTDIAALTGLTGAAEGTEQRAFEQSENAINRGFEYAQTVQDQGFQTALTELQGKIQQGYQLTANDFAASQNSLDRALEEAIQNNDIEAQTNLLGIKQEFDAQQAELGMAFSSSQAGLDRLQQLDLQANDIAASQALAELQGKIQQGLQITEQDFVKTESELDRRLKEAMQSNDIQAQSDLIQAQLDFDQWKTEAGFSFTESQNTLNRGLELSLQSNDQGFQESMLKMKEAIDLNFQMNENDWQSIENDLNRQFEMARQNNDFVQQENILNMQQDFQGVQNEMNRIHDENIQNMIIDQDKWKQGRIEELQQKGWDFESAQSVIDREHQAYMQEFEWQKKQLMQDGMNEFEAEQQAQQMAWQSNEATVDRQLQREIESGRLTLEQARLAQEGSQFESQQEFDQWALNQQLSDNDKNRIWQSIESSKDRAFDMQMTQIEQAFTQKNIDFNALMSQIQNLPAEQAAELMQQTAIDAGLTYNTTIKGSDIVDEMAANNMLTDRIEGVRGGFMETAIGMGMDEAEADQAFRDFLNNSDMTQSYSVSGAGLKPTGGELMAELQLEAKLEPLRTKLDLGEQLTPEEYEEYKAIGTHKPLSFTEDDMLQEVADARDSRLGKRAYRFTDAAWNWVNSNIGSVFQAPSGELYKIQGVWEPGTTNADKGKRGFVTLESLKDGSSVQWEGGSTTQWNGIEL